ncbi:MAG TPA: 3-hydroxybutyrate oligomer hydrolase family protein [Ramlibacter sp.]|nr:3-hydroxybutyrate oligomer hydrolase family protein [Ramlibacter sp.]
MSLRKQPGFRSRLALVLGAGAAALTACGGGGGSVSNELPAGITEVSTTVYPATSVTPAASATSAASQDLLTGGLGKTGFAFGTAAGAYADPLNPTAAELRRNSLRASYQGLVDATAGGGYGSLYGPNVTAAGAVTASEGLIPGREYLARLDDGSGRKQTAIAVMVPDAFDTNSPCVVVGPSSGSRGVYGAIGTAGEWGLKRGCAVALTDAGKGVGLYDPTDDTVNRIDGTRATRTLAGMLAHYAAAITDAARAAFNLDTPDRLSLKHAHSQQNPEKDWGSDTLAAGRYALYVLNKQFGVVGNPAPLNGGNTLVIAGSASNGGSAVLAAGEQDTAGLIDGVVAGEPLIEMPTAAGYGIQLGGVPVAAGAFGRTPIDFITYGNLYQPCALLAADAVMSETSTFNLIPTASALGGIAALRCAGLAAKGLVTGATTAEQAADALTRLRAYGWTADHDKMHNAHYGLGNGPVLSAMYTMAYGRASLTDNLCASSFAVTNPATGTIIPIPAATKAQSFALLNGTAAAGVTLVYNNSVGGPKLWTVALSPSSGAFDFGLDNALCQRALVTGTDAVSGAALTAASTPTAAQSAAVRAGIAEVVLSGKLRAKPTIVVSGRSDALLPVNNNARAYAAFNRVTDGGTSKLTYYEVTNAQHFDAFLPFGGFDTRFVPLHRYFNQAMDLMYAHLKSGAALPPSQVVRTTPRGGTPLAAPAITPANVPPISAAPAAADQIGFSGTAITVPN